MSCGFDVEKGLAGRPPRVTWFQMTVNWDSDSGSRDAGQWMDMRALGSGNQLALVTIVICGQAVRMKGQEASE